MNRLVARVIRRDAMLFDSAPKLSHLMPKKPKWPIPLVVPTSGTNAIFRFSPEEYYSIERSLHPLNSAPKIITDYIGSSDKPLTDESVPTWKQLSPDVQKIYIQRSLNFRSKKLIEMYAPFKEAFIQWKLQKYHPIPLLTSTAVASLRQIYDHEWDKMKKFDRQTISRRIQLESVDPTLWAVYQYLSGRVNRDMLRQCDGSMNEVIERMWLENWQKDECKSLKEKVFLKFKLDQIKNGDGGNSATAIGRQLFLREARNVLLHSRQIMDVDARAKTLWRLLSEDQKTDYRVIGRYMQLCPDCVEENTLENSIPNINVSDQFKNLPSATLGEPLQLGVHAFMLNLMMSRQQPKTPRLLLEETAKGWSSQTSQERQYWSKRELEQFPIPGTLLYNLFRPRDVLTPGTYSAQRALELSCQGLPVLSKISNLYTESLELCQRFQRFKDQMNVLPRTSSGNAKNGIRLSSILHAITAVSRQEWASLRVKKQEVFEEKARILIGAHYLIWKIPPQKQQVNSFLKFMHSFDISATTKDVLERAKTASELWRKEQQVAQQCQVVLKPESEGAHLKQTPSDTTTEPPTKSSDIPITINPGEKQLNRLSGYGVFYQEFVSRRRSTAGEKYEPAKVMRDAANEWQSLDADQKKQYHRRSEQIKQLSITASTSKTLEPAKNDPATQSADGKFRKISAYNIFLQGFVSRARSSDSVHREPKQVMIDAGKEWRSLDTDKKWLYQQRADRVNLLSLIKGRRVLNAYNIFMRYRAYLERSQTPSLSDIAHEWVVLPEEKKNVLKKHAVELAELYESADLSHARDGFPKFVSSELNSSNTRNIKLNDISNRWLDKMFGT